MSKTREYMVNHPNDVLLTDLPNDVLLTVAKFAPVDKPYETTYRLICSNKGMYTLFHRDITKHAVRTALSLAADASEDAVPKLLKMLDKNSKLLLEKESVVTRSGLIAENVTIYEFLLGAGDPDLAEQVAAYFANFEGGEAARIEQYEKYKPYIDGMLEQAPYDLTPLIDIIKQASPADVQAALNKDPTSSALNKALAEFRQAVSLKKITQPQMHYNYQTLIHAFDLHHREWDDLYRLSGNNYDKLNLILRQVIGYLQRDLPAGDRFAFAMNIYDLVDKKKPLARKIKCQSDSSGSFLDIPPGDASLCGHGFDYGIYAGWRLWNWPWRGETPPSQVVTKLCRAKTSHLQNLCSVNQNRNFSAM